MTYLTEYLNACKLNFKKLRVLTRVMLSLTFLITLLLAPLNLFVAEAEEEPAPTGPKANQVLTSEDGRVTINFHPELQRESGPYPVLRVQVRPISQDFMDNFLKLYMSDLTLYPAKLITMQEELAHADERIAELEERQKTEEVPGAHEPYIAYLKQLQTDGLENIKIWEPNPSESEERLDSCLDFVHSLQSEDPECFALIGEEGDSYSLLTLEQPEDFNYFSFNYQKTSYPVDQSIYTIEPIRFSLYPQGHVLSQEEAEKISSLVDGEISRFYLDDSFLPSGIENGEDFNKAIEQIADLDDQHFTNVITSSAPEWSREEALQVADDLVKSLGLEHLQLTYQEAAMATCFGSSSENSNDEAMGKKDDISCYLTPVWKFIYYPSYANHTFAYNIYSIPDKPFMLDEQVSFEKLLAPWNFESLEFALGMDGLISLSYRSPMEVKEEISPDAQLLSEDEILSLAETMLVRKEEDIMAQTRAPQDQVELNIEYATLTPYRILDQDDPLQGTIVPVWNFYGSKSLVYQVADNNFIFQHSKNPYDSFLTLNALDGTVIDLTKGK